MGRMVIFNKLHSFFKFNFEKKFKYYNRKLIKHKNKFIYIIKNIQKLKINIKILLFI